MSIKSESDTYTFEITLEAAYLPDDIGVARLVRSAIINALLNGPYGLIGCVLTERQSNTDNNLTTERIDAFNA